MRSLPKLVAAGATLALALACSSSDPSPPAPALPVDSDGGGGGGVDASSGGSSSGSSGTTDPKQWVATTTEQLVHQGATRRYVLSVPLDYDAGKKYPLYLFLHGNPGNAESAATFAIPRVTTNEAIVAYPGSLVLDGWDHGASTQDNVDSSFILAVLDALAAKYSIDTQRVLLSGWSGGGFMASAMACRFYARFRAIGVHAGGAPYDTNDPNGTPACAGASIATLVTHGQSDDNVPFDGGKYAAQYWSEHNGCSGSASASAPAPCETYDGCPAGKPVKRCFVAGLAHPLWDQALAVEWAWFKALP
ncbi:MAG: prolyl oligopeptidase family serine peptidase [Polyangiaceae bacterium]